MPIRGDVDLFAELLGDAADRRHHRHQRQVDHDRADPPSAGDAPGVDAVLGGNIGRPVFELEPGPPERVFVLELSSFQLDLCDALRCRVAVWLNLTPDHLDRHGDLAGYVAAKERHLPATRGRATSP